MRVFEVSSGAGPNGYASYDGCGMAIAAVHSGTVVAFWYTTPEFVVDDAADLADDFPDCAVLTGTMSCYQFVVE